MSVENFFKNLWRDYVNMTPQAESIARALEARGNVVQNDHVAFRTFNRPPIALSNLERLLTQELNYTRHPEPYFFEAKKLNAYGYLPPSPTQPRIFLSELKTEELTGPAQDVIGRLLDQINPEDTLDPSVFWHGPFWQVPTWEEYQLLANESSYAAWLSVIGLRCNHFTIDVNALENHKSIEEMNEFVEELGFVVNDSGGRVKGSKEVLLEQGSTMASEMLFEFQAGDTHSVPTCYYEYARRYPDKEGNIYQGFVAASADKIFESTGGPTRQSESQKEEL